MEQRDYLMRQIEQLGQVLAKMLARLLGIKQKGSPSFGLEELRQTYKNELDIDLEELIHIPENDIIIFLKNKNKYFEHHLEMIADILHTTAENHYKNDRLDDGNNLLRKSIYILEYIHSTGKDFSIDRVSKIETLKDLLKK
jgi:hypothetical protein